MRIVFLLTLREVEGPSLLTLLTLLTLLAPICEGSLEGSTADGGERLPKAQSRGTASIEDSDLVGKDPSSTFQFFNRSNSKPFQITSLAHPRILSSVESHPYRKDRGGLPLCPGSVLPSFGKDLPLQQRCKFAPLFSITSTMPRPQPFSFHTFALLPGGGWLPPSRLGNAQGGIRRACRAA